MTTGAFTRAAVFAAATISAAGLAVPAAVAQEAESGPSGDIVYLTPGLDLAFWRYLSRGVENAATEAGYGFQVLDSTNDAQTQRQNAQDAIARDAAGIVLSPTDSSTAPGVLELAEEAGIPVVIADIGTDSGAYVSFIISDNYEGAYGVGEALAEAIGEDGGSVGIIAISQARINGQERTQGFRDAMAEAGLTDEAGLQQMQAYTADETYRFTQDMLTSNPDLSGLFVQTDLPTLGAVQAVRAARAQGDVLVAAFDGVPEFVPMLQSGEIVASGMQQPYLMGQEAGQAMVAHLAGEEVEEEIVVPIKVVTSDNIDDELDTIRETVFANELE